jgi:4a-hydroxytetrahydrobiopterin dehydratase
MSELLTADDVAASLTTLHDWSGDTSAITRKAKLATFLGAIDVVDRVAQVAEGMDHHPDIDIRWRTLIFTLATHSAGGVTAKDFTLAAKIDEILATAP